MTVAHSRRYIQSSPEGEHDTGSAPNRRRRALFLHHPGHLADAAGFKHPVPELRMEEHDFPYLFPSQGRGRVHHLARRIMARSGVLEEAKASLSPSRAHTPTHINMNTHKYTHETDACTQWY